jgi:hypothetical protein
MSDSRPLFSAVATRHHHQCPGGCGRSVPNRLYACGPCWRALPREIQRAIHATVHDPLLSPKRTATFTAASAYYAARRHQRELLTEQLQTALNNRSTVEQAKGILAERADVTVGEAVEPLRDYARGRDQKLADVADAIVRRDPAVADIVPRAGSALTP